LSVYSPVSVDQQEAVNLAASQLVLAGPRSSWLAIKLVQRSVTESIQLFLLLSIFGQASLFQLTLRCSALPLP